MHTNADLLTTHYDGRSTAADRVCRMVLSKSTENLLDSTVDLQVDEEIDIYIATVN